MADNDPSEMNSSSQQDGNGSSLLNFTPTGDANVIGVQSAAEEAQEVQQQHAKIAFQVLVPYGPRWVQHQKRRHHH